MAGKKDKKTKGGKGSGLVASLRNAGIGKSAARGIARVLRRQGDGGKGKKGKKK